MLELQESFSSGLESGESWGISPDSKASKSRPRAVDEGGRVVAAVKVTVRAIEAPRSMFSSIPLWSTAPPPSPSRPLLYVLVTTPTHE